MDELTFLELFDEVVEAPGGLDRLRRLVLDLAVQGRLVPNEGGDASHLVAEAQDAIEGLVRSGKAKKPRKFPRPPLDDGGLPNGWVTAALGDVSLVVMGNSPPGDSYNDAGAGVPLINGPVEFSPPPLGATLREKFTTAPTSMCEEGDLIVCVRGATTGRTNVAAFDACIGRGVALVRAWRAQPFINIVVWRLGERLLAMGRGTTFPSINYADLAGLRIAIPPLPEQQRIVQKVNDVMALCHELERCRLDRQATLDSLRSEALRRIGDVSVDSKKPERASEDLWTDFADSPGGVSQIVDTVRELAVSGRLSRSTDSDEPASALLARCRDAKAEAIRESAAPKQKPIGELTDPPFELPEGWAWARMDDCFLVTGGITKSSKRTPAQNAHPYLRVANVQRGRLDLDEISEFELFDGELERYSLRPGDLLVVEGNGSESEIGRCARWDGELDGCVHQNHLIRCRPLEPGLEYYTLLYLNSPIGVAVMKDLAVTTSGLYNLSVGKIRAISVPIPPLAERKRLLGLVQRFEGIGQELSESLVARDASAETLSRALVQSVSSARGIPAR